MLTIYSINSDEIELPPLLIGGVHAYYRKAKPLTNHTSRTSEGGLLIRIGVQVIPYVDAAFTTQWPASNWPSTVTISTDENTAVNPITGAITYAYQGMQRVYNVSTGLIELITETLNYGFKEWLIDQAGEHDIQTRYYRRKYDAGTVDMKAEETHHILQAAYVGRFD